MDSGNSWTTFELVDDGTLVRNVVVAGDKIQFRLTMVNSYAYELTSDDLELGEVVADTTGNETVVSNDCVLDKEEVTVKLTWI